MRNPDRNRRTTILVALMVLTLGVGVGVGLARAEQDKEAPPSRIPPVVPEDARNRENPIPADERSVEYGGMLYSSQCVMCHGKSGAGDGDLVGRLSLQMPDFTDAASIAKRTDGELFYILTEGHGSMPDKSRFDERTRWDLVNYVRTLPVDVR